MTAHLHPLPDAAAAAAWLRARVPAGATLVTDSRRVRAGDAFIAWPGAATDGRRYVGAALAAGASAAVIEAEGAGAFALDDARIAAFGGLKAAAGVIADAWFGRPSARLDLVATTGTNGKTSTAWWTAQALGALGRRCGVVGTLGIGEPPPAAPGGEPPPAATGGEPQPSSAPSGDGGLGTVEPTGLTTPDPITFHAALRRFADAGVEACALEASSIGIVEERLAGARIRVALFTNFTQDHLDYHGSMAAYWAAKRRLFDWPGLQAAVVNVDDLAGARLADELAQRPDLDLWTVSLQRRARLRGSALRYGESGIGFTVHESGADLGPATPPSANEVAEAEVRSSQVGDYNASNLIVVLGALRALGVPLADAARALAGVTAVPGRMQRLAGAGLEVVVDYAHTPDALEKVLGALRPLAESRGGRLVAVFGCGGNRDPGKRPVMGAIAARLADHVVITSDNPRDEEPRVILEQIRAGIDPAAHARTRVVENRAEAIAGAIGSATAGDVIVLAGKGHEDYQEIAGVRRPFSDLAEARRALAARGAGAAPAGTGVEAAR